MAKTPGFTSRCQCGCNYVLDVELRLCPQCGGWHWVAVKENKVQLMPDGLARIISPPLTAESALVWLDAMEEETRHKAVIERHGLDDMSWHRIATADV